MDFLKCKKLGHNSEGWIVFLNLLIFVGVQKEEGIQSKLTFISPSFALFFYGT